ncbi:MFS transporter [Brevibacillus fluminis]|uniref:MFS transporter n=1 Tax=Brevibacillus fluminis TaxID=511487 RepID=A0A3M8DCZ1_9BACL|nr:MFS transporter [Brevibacillus fluminis]RNB85886.1 MFS transporter [Brevibacillus fluminis]
MPSLRLMQTTFIVLVGFAGVSQGLTLPLLAILLEQQGVSSIANGVNAAAMYIGVMLVSPFLERLLQRLGYRGAIILGLILLISTTVLIPLSSGLVVWFFLRLFMGSGDSLLHYNTQLWLTAIAPPEKRGRMLSIYGLAYGVGFSIGPLGINLLPLGLWVPFVLVSILYTSSFFLLSRLKNVFPEPMGQQQEGQNRFAYVFRYGWLALIPSFLYGYMESSLNGSFPIFGLRIGLSMETVSILLPSFVLGALILQMPLGAWSDKVGRKKIMMSCAVIGGIAFILFPLAQGSLWMMLMLLVIAGAVVGSFYSLGMAYAADILPSYMVPAVGVIVGVNFSAGSIIAPNLNGVLLGVSPGLMFTVMGLLLLAFAIAGIFFRVAAPHATRKKEEQAAQTQSI